MSEALTYDVLFYGGPNGYLSNRAQIRLYDTDHATLVRLRFRDPGLVLPADAESFGVWHMYLPSSMFQSVLDVLRNEGPVQFYAGLGEGGVRRGFLGTFAEGESVGEGEV
jgi:hypothetical protein